MSSIKSVKTEVLAEEISHRIVIIMNNIYGGSQASMAKSVGASQQTVSQWKMGESVPGGKHLAVLSKNGVDINWLLTGRGIEPTTPLALDDPSLEGLGGVALVFAMYPEARKRIVDNARRLAKAIEDERREGGPNQHPPLYQ